MKVLPYFFAAKDKILNHGVKLFYAKGFYHLARRQLNLPKFEDTIVTSIRRKNNFARISHIVDDAIEKILNEDIYTPQKPLAIINPYCMAPLTALLVFNTKNICQVRTKVCDEYEYQFEGTPGNRHRIPILYLRAGRKNKIKIEILEEGNVQYTRTIYLRTCPLPNMLKDMVTVTKHDRKSASPLTFVYGGDTRYPYAFDENGEIRFFLSERPKAYGLFPLAGGRFLFLSRNICNPSFSNPHAILAYEMDFLGRVFQEYYIPDGIHHDACEVSPGGNILTVSSSMKQYVEDAIIEIDRQTGKIVKKTCLEHILSSHPYFDYFDWAHINTVSYIPEEHAVLICARNLHSVIKFDWNTDELCWIFCDTSFWKNTPYADYVLTPEKDMPFSYQAHAAYFLPERTQDGSRKLILFDNHWHARRPIQSFDGDKFSHARIYEINEAASTVRLLEDFRCPKSKIRSNAITIGDRAFAMCGFLNKNIKDHAGTIIEYDRATGKPVNRYLTYNSFYRAWPLFADCQKLSLPMETIGETFHLSSENLTECTRPDTEDALCLPFKPQARLPKKLHHDRRGPNKFEKIRAYHAGHKPLDTAEGLSLLEIRFYGGLLLIGCRDHLLEYIFLLGEKNSFKRDYTNTVQKSPALFEDAVYYLSIPTRNLPKDTYSIFVQCEGKLYNTKKHFSIDKS